MRPVYILFASSILVLDQATKWIVVARLSPDSIVPVIPGLFSLVLVENKGIAFGLLAGLSSSVAFALIILVSAAALGLVCYLLWKSEPSARRAPAALSFILGGAFGNLVDRIFRGSVVDFLDFYVRSYHWPAFNVADSAIVVGAGILALDLFAGRKEIAGSSL
jgi:signal peptidase II